MELWSRWLAAIASALLCVEGAAVAGTVSQQKHLRVAGEESATSVASASLSARLEGIRRCLGLAPGEEMEVSAEKQRFGPNSFLVARQAGKPRPVGQTALHATYEALLEGGCDENPDHKQAWFVDVGSNDLELMALASSTGCGVSVLDADVASARAEEMTGCLNQERNRPIKVMRLQASDATEAAEATRVTKEAAATTASNTSNTTGQRARTVTLDSIFENPQLPGPSSASISVLKLTPPGEGNQVLRAMEGAEMLLSSGRIQCLVTHMNFDLNSTEKLISRFSTLEHNGYRFAHLGALDYPALDVTDAGTYPLFHTDTKQLQELFDSYRKIRAFDERAGFRVYSGSLSLDRNGHYFDYTDFVVACRNNFPSKLTLREKGQIRFSGGSWWLEGPPTKK